MKTRRMLILFALGLGLALAVLWLLCGGTAPATAAPAYRPLHTPGDVITVCLSGGCDYTSVQAAVDAAGDGDVIKVAAGTYTDVHVRPRNDITTTGVVTQVVYVSKTVTIRGGYTTTNGFADPPDPEANPTTLDAQGQGRVFYIVYNTNSTIEGLRITGGDATGLGGGWDGSWSHDAGGGLYLYRINNATLSNNIIISNTAPHDGYGGGVFLRFGNATLISGNTIVCNTAGDRGGGLYLYYGGATLNNNTITANTAYDGGGLYLVGWPTLSGNTIAANTARNGGGLYLIHGAATLNNNTIISNTADNGGGLFLQQSDATLSGNTVTFNTADAGGGLYLQDSDAMLNGNTIVSNSAGDDGGGLFLFVSDATLSNNTVISNTAGDDGGGLFLEQSDDILNGNTITANTAGGSGGGLFLRMSDAALINNVVTDNQANTTGSGLYIVWGSSPHLLHNTIARNTGGDGSGVYVTEYIWSSIYSTVSMTNTILVSHTVGITVTVGNTATLEATLWNGNTTDWGGAGTINHSNDYIGDPAFVNPDAGDYHIASGSVAIDTGVDTWVSTDIDHEPRFYGDPDLGADEYWPPGALKRIYLPVVLRQYQ